MPVATWIPCVIRYRPAGRAGGSNHDGGFCWRCDHRPVAKHVVKRHPSAMPSHAAVRSSCNALVKRSLGGLIVVHRGVRSDDRRPPMLRRLRRSIARGDGGPRRSGPTVVHRNQGPAAVAVSARTSIDLVLGVVGIDLDNDPPVVAQQRRCVTAAPPGLRRSRCCRRRAARIASDAAPGNAVEHGAMEHVDAAIASDVEEPLARCRCRVRRRDVRRGRPDDVRVRIRRRARDRRHGQVLDVQPRRPGPNQRAQARQGLGRSDGAERDRCFGDRRHRRRWGVARSRGEMRAGSQEATARASSIVSTSRSSCSSLTRSPSAASRARCYGRCQLLTSPRGRTRRSVVPRKPIAQYPPSAAGPNTASVVGGERASTTRRRADRMSAVGCPSRRRRPDRRCHRPRQQVVRRARQRPAGLLPSVWHPASRVPSSARTRQSQGCRRRRRMCRPAPPRERAACSAYTADTAVS